MLQPRLQHCELQTVYLATQNTHHTSFNLKGRRHKTLKVEENSTKYL